MAEHSIVTTKSLFTHVAGLIWCGFGVYYGRVHYNMPAFQKYGGRFQFLTMWASYLLFLGTAVGTVVDLSQLAKRRNEKKNSFKKGSSLLLLRDDFMVIWATLNWLVPILYWSVAYFDREGIHSIEVESYYPFNGWYNHYLHSIPAFYVLLAVINVNYTHPPLTRALVYIIICFSAYISWLIWLANLNGVYVYPFLNKLSTEGFVIFIVSSCLLGFFVYLIIKFFSVILWGNAHFDAAKLK